MKIQLKHKKQGFVMGVVLLVTVVLSILFLSTIGLVQNNTKQIVHQDDQMRAHYLARSAIDIAYTALMTENGGIRKIDQFISGSQDEISDVLLLPGGDSTMGSVDITVARKEDEVAIIAVASLANGKSKLTLYFDKSDFSRSRWVHN
jgi:type II secretory pathway pseudopilin PulG